MAELLKLVPLRRNRMGGRECLTAEPRTEDVQGLFDGRHSSQTLACEPEPAKVQPGLSFRFRSVPVPTQLYRN